MKSIISKLAMAALMAMSFSISASAIPITGSVWINSVIDPVLNSASLATATGTTTTAKGIITNSSTGDYAPYYLTLVDFYAFNWSPASVPVLPLWRFPSGGPTVGSFDLLSLTVNSQSATFLNISGSGVLHLTGFDPTPGSWAFTITDADGLPNKRFKFGFSSSSTALAVPESTIPVLLIAMGLVGIGLVTRRYSRRSEVKL